MMWPSLRMWGGEKIENEIEWLVKILTKCKMKLRSRRKEEGGPAFRALPPPSQAAAGALSRSCSRSFSPHRFCPLSLHPAYLLLRSSLSAATSRQAVAPAILAPAVLLLPFLLHKITEAEERKRGGGVVPSQPTQLAGPAVAAPSSPAGPYPFIQSDGSSPLSGHNGIFSAAIGTIGKQRPKINYLVSSPSLTNK